MAEFSLRYAAPGSGPRAPPAWPPPRAAPYQARAPLYQPRAPSYRPRASLARPSAPPSALPVPPDNTASMDFKDSSHGAYLHDGVKDLWITKHFTDIVLKAGDVQIPCHKFVLRILSPHFQRVLSTETPNTSGDESKTLEVSDVPSELLAEILQYMYTGEIRITSETVQGLIKAAGLWQISGLVTLCTVFIQNNVKIDNVFTFLELSSLLEMKELEEKCLAFITTNFSKFTEQWQLQQKFHEIGSKHLCKILESDALGVASEDDACMAALEWFKHKPEERIADIYEVFRHVRLTFVDPVALAHLQTESLLQPELRCQHLFSFIETSLNSGYYPEELISCRPRKSYDYITCMVLPDKLPSVSFVKLGGAISRNAVERVADVPWASNGCIKACCRSGSDVFVSGVGNSGDEVWKFDLSTMAWSQYPSLKNGRRQHSFVVANKHLYVLGGSSVGSLTKALSSVESLNLVFPEDWRKTSRGLIHRVRNCAHVSHGKLIYLFGGMDAMNKVTSHVQIFDTETELCKANLTRVPSLLVGGQAVAWKNQFFILGRDVFYIYNHEYNNWVTTRLGVSMSHFGCVLASSALYIFGGFAYEGDRTTCSGKVYKITVKNVVKNKRKWVQVEDLAVPMCVYSAVDVGYLREFVSTAALNVIMPPTVEQQSDFQDAVLRQGQGDQGGQENDDSDALPSYDEVMQMIASETPSAPPENQLPEYSSQYFDENSANENTEVFTESETAETDSRHQGGRTSTYGDENFANDTRETWQPGHSSNPLPSAPALTFDHLCDLGETSNRLSSLSVSSGASDRPGSGSRTGSGDRQSGRERTLPRRDSDAEAVWL